MCLIAVQVKMIRSWFSGPNENDYVALLLNEEASEKMQIYL